MIGIDHAKHRPVGARVAHLREVSPGQGNAVAAIHRPQISGRVGVEEMPVRIGRHLGHAPHHHRRGELELRARFHPVALAGEEAPERHARREQRAGKEAALEVAPRVQHVLGIHAGSARAALGTAAHLPARGVRGLQPISAVQHLVGDVRREIELQARRVRQQGAVGVHHARRFEERAHHAAHLAVLVARQHRLAVEPADLQPVAPAQAQQILGRQREAPLAHVVGGALQVGEIIARQLLMRADEKVRELPAAGAGLGEQLRYRHLQQALGEQERRLERDACDGAAKGGRGQLEIRALVEEPRRGTLKYRGEKLEQPPGGGALAALDHAQVGDRGRDAGVTLNTAHRQLFQGQAVALA